MKPDQVPETDRKYVRQIVLLTALCAVATLVSSTSGPAFAADERADSLQDAGNPSFCETAGGCEIPYQYLSSEETDPYLVSGEPPNKRADVRAAARWPDVRSCLVREERIAEKPDIAKIDWQRMRHAVDIEVCMFRIFSSIRSEAGFASWFAAQDLKRVWVADTAARSSVDGSKIDLRLMDAKNSLVDTNRFYVSEGIFPAPMLKWIVFNERFLVKWRQDGDVYDTGYERTSRL